MAKSGGIYFKVTDEERELIKQRMALANIRNMSAYIRKMCNPGQGFLLYPAQNRSPACRLRYQGYG